MQAVAPHMSLIPDYVGRLVRSTIAEKRRERELNPELFRRYAHVLMKHTTTHDN